jgi:hypothetical protein
MSYKITQWTKKRADDFGYTIKPSVNKNKKIDVFENNKKIGSIGAINYGDYGTYLKTKGKIYADKKKKGYLARTKWCDKPNSNCRLARDLLW